jgi:hypothetical protein
MAQRCPHFAQRPPTQPSSVVRVTTPDHGYAARKSSRISDSAHKSLDCHQGGGGGTLRQLAEARRCGRDCPDSCIHGAMNPSRKGRLCRAPWWRRARFTTVRVHDNRVDPHAKEKPA